MMGECGVRVLGWCLTQPSAVLGGVIAVLAGVTVLVGATVHRPVRSLGWHLLGGTFVAAGLLVYIAPTVLLAVGLTPEVATSVAIAGMLTGAVTGSSAFNVLQRDGGPRRPRAGAVLLVGSAAVVAGVAFLVEPTSLVAWGGEGRPLLRLVLSLLCVPAFAAGPALLLHSPRCAARSLLTVAAVLAVPATILLTVQLGAGLVGIMWLASALCIAAAALSPSMTTIGDAADGDQGWLRRAPLAGAPLIVGPILVLALDWSSSPSEAAILAAVMLAVLGLAWRREARAESERARRADALEGRARFLSGVLDALPSQTAVVGLDGRIVAVNRRWTQLAVDVGADPATSGVGTDYLGLCARLAAEGDVEVARTAAGIRAVLVGARAGYEHDYSCVAPAGELWYQLRVTPLDDGTGVVVSHTDITWRRKTDAQLQLRVRQQEAIARFGDRALEGVPTAVLLDDASRLLVELLDADLSGAVLIEADDDQLVVAAAHGWQAEIVGRRLPLAASIAGDAIRARKASYHRGVSEDERVHLAAVLHDEGATTGLAAPIRKGDVDHGALIAFSRDPDALGEADLGFVQAVANALGSALDRVRREEVIVHQATHDPVTGLPNHHRFRTLLDELDGSNRVAVVALDVEGLSDISRSLGHAALEAALVAVGRRLVDHRPPPDVVGTTAGDRFLILCHDVEESSLGALVAGLRAAVARPLLLNGARVFVRSRIGVCRWGASEGGAEEALRRSELALDAARRQDVPAAVFTEDMDLGARDRLRLETDVRHALARDELRLVFQPQVDLATGVIVGLEALVRWQHPEHGLVGAGPLVGAAQRTGLMVALDRWVLWHTCAQARRWMDAGLDVPTVSVNVAVPTLQREGFARSVERTLHAAGLDPSHLEVEITEDMLVTQPELAIQALDDLRRLGVRIAIDDFGTGHSSLSYLQRFHVDTLKIDRSFVSTLSEPPSARNVETGILKGLVALASHLDLRIVAEGVETALQRDVLALLGCRVAQGHLYCRPAPADAIAGLLAALSTTVAPPARTAAPMVGTALAMQLGESSP